jgi:hypothetical protein
MANVNVLKPGAELALTRNVGTPAVAEESSLRANIVLE